MKIKHISFKYLQRRKGKVFFLIVGLTIGITTAVTLISITRMMNEDISNKLDEFGANILILPQSDALSLNYGGMSLGGVSIDAHSLRDSDIPKIRQIKNRENINIISPKLIEVVEIEGKKVPLMGVQFQEEVRLKKWWKVQGTVPKTQEEVLLGSETAVQLSKMEGDTLSLMGKSVSITGILEETGSQDDFLIFGDLNFVQAIAKKPGVLSLVEIAAFCNTCPIEEIVQQIL